MTSLALLVSIFYLLVMALPAYVLDPDTDLSAADASFWGEDAGDGSGASVASAGDVNGDGYSDVIVGAPDYDNGQSNEGWAFVWYGSATGLGASGTPANADWTAESNQATARFGYSVASAGDVNGDGYSDIIVGAYFFDNGESNEGWAFVWYGSSGGLGASGTFANADWTAQSNQANARFGNSVASAGDVNGDGYSDVIIGTVFYDNGEAYEGEAFVWYGSSGSLGAGGTPANADWTAESNQFDARLGFSVASAGDVNGDTYSDIIIGAMNYSNGEGDEGAAFVWYGSSGGLGASGTPANADCILNGKEYAPTIKEYGQAFPHAGYGGMFRRWLVSDKYEPYNSFGNGSAMRVSPVGFAYSTLNEVVGQAGKSAAVTHNHPEGIKGAQAVATAIWLGRNGKNKSEIKDHIEQTFNYDLGQTLDDIRPNYSFDETCQETVPQSIIAFLESNDYEDAVRKSISLGGDSDTMACITGSIAQAYYKEIPEYIIERVRDIIPAELLGIIDSFNERFLVK